MSVSYDVFIDAFLNKIDERKLISLPSGDRQEIVTGYMARAISGFKHICKYDLTSTRDDVNERFNVDIPDSDIDEIIDIVSEGMVVQWLKPYTYRQELLEQAINTRDFTTYSPAELLKQVGAAYEKTSKNYTNMIREYSYANGNLTDLHL